MFGCEREPRSPGRRPCVRPLALTPVLHLFLAVSHFGKRTAAQRRLFKS